MVTVNMLRVNMLRKLLEPHGFVQHDTPGFLAFHRTHEDGRLQLVHFFTWSNPKHADRTGVPHAYLVVAPALDVAHTPGEPRYGQHEDGRFTIIQKGVGGQPVRAWADVAGEFEKLFIPAFNETSARGREILNELSVSHPLPPRRELVRG